MYAVIETGGKQYRVELGTELEVELLDAEPGQEINLDRVLLVVDGDQSAVGQPVVEDAAVSAQVLRQDRGEKTISFKYRPKARSRVKKGHRQELTVLKITDVRLGSKSAAADAKGRGRSRRSRAKQGRQGSRSPGSGRRRPRREAQGPQGRRGGGSRSQDEDHRQGRPEDPGQGRGKAAAPKAAAQGRAEGRRAKAAAPKAAAPEGRPQDREDRSRANPAAAPKRASRTKKDE